MWHAQHALPASQAVCDLEPLAESDTVVKLLERLTVIKTAFRELAKTFSVSLLRLAGRRRSNTAPGGDRRDSRGGDDAPPAEEKLMNFETIGAAFILIIVRRTFGNVQTAATP